MIDYITLNEIYIFNPKLFKNKSLKSFVKIHKIHNNDMVTKDNKILGIKKNWVKQNIPYFDHKLEEYNEKNCDFYEAIPTLRQYLPKLKTFNPIGLNLNSTLVKYFDKEGERTPYFTKKGYMKIKILFNDFDDQGYLWLYELTSGTLVPQLYNLQNIIEMVNLKHTPVIKNINGQMVLSNHIYNIEKEDIIVDFKRIGDLKKEKNLNYTIEDYKCPLYSQLQINFEKGLKEAETNYENKLKQLSHEKVIQHLQQELNKEKCLKDQVIALTQSFIPAFANDEKSPSPYSQKHESNKGPNLLKPSKIK